MFYPIATPPLVEKNPLPLCSAYRDERTYYPKFASDVDPDDTIQHLEGGPRPGRGSGRFRGNPSARPGRFGAPAVATEPEGWPPRSAAGTPARRPLHSQRPRATAAARAHPPRWPARSVPGSRRPPVGRTRGMIRWPSSLSWLKLQTSFSLKRLGLRPWYLSRPASARQVQDSRSQALTGESGRVRKLAQSLRAEGARRDVRRL
ncbi:uncharacterized protein [Ovis canadensis]|uniref:uncharacterized protein n=1 Tax=Ovis canadensis TaxID=37174 RepID=UPI003752A16D